MVLTIFLLSLIVCKIFEIKTIYLGQRMININYGIFYIFGHNFNKFQGILKILNAN